MMAGITNIDVLLKTLQDGQTSFAVDWETHLADAKPPKEYAKTEQYNVYQKTNEEIQQNILERETIKEQLQDIIKLR